MKIELPSFEILTDISPFAILELEEVEKAARTCYKSEDKYEDQAASAKRLIKKLIENGHEAMLEHSTLSVKFICDRGVANELVRHRVASFAQESTRYCNYSHDRFGRSVSFIYPVFLCDGTAPFKRWMKCMKEAEKGYFELINMGLKPEEARDVLPLSLKTEIVITANWREWRHILKLRTAPGAHIQMRELMCPLLKELKSRIPVVFDDIPNPECQDLYGRWKTILDNLKEEASEDE